MTLLVASNILSYVGEESVNEARKLGNYTDRTGNLRSSIGYAVTVEGRTEYGELQQVKQGAQGCAEGKTHLQELASQRQGDVALHIVAGMDYAEYVERNYKVLSPARVLADREVPAMLDMSGLKYKKI